MNHWPRIALGELLRPADEPVSVRKDGTYPNFGIYSYGRGLFAKPAIGGMTTSASVLRRVRSGNFIYSRLFAFEGSYGIVDDAFDGHYVSNEYPSFDLDMTRLLPGFVKAYFQLPSVWKSIAMGSKGVGSRRIRVHPDKVLAHKMPLPALDVQRAIIARLDALAERTRQLANHLDAMEADAKHLLALAFHDAIANVPYLPMADVAPLVRREVVVDSEGRYPELGIRSFGKGTFHKPEVSGLEIGTKRLYRIEPGDLVFSNVFAWEGAIAIAKPQDIGRVGSHRFMTCVVDSRKIAADLLHYYFLSPEGMEKIRAASPGGAGRNRTLGVEKLMQLTVPVPSMALQRKFQVLQAKIVELRTEHDAVRNAKAALLPAVLERVFNNRGVEEESMIDVAAT